MFKRKNVIYWEKEMKNLLLCLFVISISFIEIGFCEFIDNNDGTVTDTKTGLMWQQSGGGRMTWENAITYCEELHFAYKNDWRLPSKNELQSIIDYNKYEPAVDATIDCTNASYWTSTSYARNNIYAWSVSLRSGFIHNNTKTNSLDVYVIAVRSEQ